EHTMENERPAWLPNDESLRAMFGETVAYPYYRLRTTEYIARLLPRSGACSIVDIGAGDGYLGAILERFRPETSVVGLETHIRPLRRTDFKLAKFDGLAAPFADKSFDYALLCNVLHHAGDQGALLREALRLARRGVIIKDHLADTRFQHFQLAVLDVLGNRRFGASTVGRYLSTDGWASLFHHAAARPVEQLVGLSFRQGLLRAVFRNRLEIMYVVAPAPAT
ncbi:MAG TPA: methyltransferase domain-containing protein, partial [Candidatus Limnocylindrales bacterium]|nr:methyltransferase domain-containing protein [Candidatus Limnocylindrales bacterium]